MEKYVMRFYMTTVRSKKTEALELNAIHQRLSYADDVNLLVENMNIIKTQLCYMLQSLGHTMQLPDSLAISLCASNASIIC
jgi:hypothetical protein